MKIDEMTKKNKTTDRRVIRTLNSLHDAFLELLSTTDLSKISVSELSQKAGINRKTFYVYYSDVEDLLEELETRLISKFMPILEGIRNSHGIMDPYEFVKIFTSIINEDVEVYRLLSKRQLLPHFITKVKDMAIDVFITHFDLDKEPDAIKYHYFVDYTAAGILSVLSKWISDHSSMTLEEFTDITMRMSVNAFYGLVDNN